MRNRTKALLGTAVAALSTLSLPALADPITVSDPALIPYTLPYGDFNIVSLQFADTGTNSNSYYVASSPGQLLGDNAIVIGSGSGTNFTNGSPAGSPTITNIDAPYATENGKQVSYFTTATTDSTIAPTQTGATSGSFVDSFNTWNAQVGALNTALNGKDAVFYFNLNENGTTDILSGTDLLIWAKVTIVDPSGNAINGQTYYLAGNPFDPNNFPTNTCAPFSNCGVQQSVSSGAPDPTASYPDVPSGSTYDPTDERWTYVHGDICVDGSTFLHYGSCTGTDPKSAGTVDQNLGANQAAFAAYNIALDNFLADPANAGDTLQLSWEMADEDNGYEQLFILGSGAPQILVPEPASLSVVATGLAVLGFVIRRRRKAKR